MLWHMHAIVESKEKDDLSVMKEDDCNEKRAYARWPGAVPQSMESIRLVIFTNDRISRYSTFICYVLLCKFCPRNWTLQFK